MNLDAETTARLNARDIQVYAEAWGCSVEEAARILQQALVGDHIPKRLVGLDDGTVIDLNEETP
jgi:plasmid stability protein